VMVGGGDLVPALQARAARLGVAERITWHGELSAPEVAEVIAGVGVLALPSLTDAESFGMVLVEAMATGTPVVGSAVGGIPYVIRDGVDGLLVPPGDAGALAAALRAILTDPARADLLGSGGRRAAEQRWSWEHQRARTLALLSRPAAPARRLRLAVVTDAVSPWHTGGKEQRQHELWTRLAADHDIDVHVHTMKWWEGPRTIRRDGVTFHALMPLVPLYTGGRRSILQAVAFALATFRMLTRRYDVLEVDAIPFLQLFPARLVAWLRRRPMAVTWHEFWGRDYWVRYLGPAGHLAAAVERTAALLPDHVVAVSEGTAERVRAAGAVSVSLITPGIALAELPLTPRRAPNERVELLCAGRLLEHKRVDVAIDACAELIARGHAVRLRVIGAGPAAAMLADRARSTAPGAVEMIDFLPAHRDVLLAMAAADVVLFPSEREGFGMVGLEALAMGTPVVTSSHPDNFARHLVRDGVNGIVCDNSPDAVADAVERILKEHDAYAAGARASAARYEWDEIADRSAAAYRALLG
ncbi:MAG: glycosyltransferase family 4 protein, partial [Polyangia bacterium]